MFDKSSLSIANQYRHTRVESVFGTDFYISIKRVDFNARFTMH